MDMLIKLVSSTMQSFSLVLVFVLGLFGAKYPVIINCLAEERPHKDQKIAREAYRRKLKEQVITGCWIPLAIYLIAITIYSPVVIKVVKSEKWYREPILNGFVFANILLLGLTFWTIFLMRKLYKNINECKKATSA